MYGVTFPWWQHGTALNDIIMQLENLTIGITCSQFRTNPILLLYQVCNLMLLVIFVLYMLFCLYVCVNTLPLTTSGIVGVKNVSHLSLI